MRGAHVLAHAAGGDLHGTGLVVLVWLAGGVLLGGWVYVRGLRRVLDHPQGRRRHRWRAVALLCAVVIGIAVSVPPLAGWAESRLSTHMAQHITYIMVVAPLLAIAAPGQPLLAGLPRGMRRRLVSVEHRLPLGGLLTPHLAWGVHIAALWLWHLPAAYDAALNSELVHLLEHFFFLSTAWLFWWHLATLSRRRLRGPAAMAYVAAAIAPGAALGAVLTFAGSPIYPAQAASAAASGIDPLLDQRIGGLIMWIPLDYVYLAVAVALFAKWFKRMQPAPEDRQDAVATTGRAMEVHS